MSMFEVVAERSEEETKRVYAGDEYKQLVESVAKGRSKAIRIPEGLDRKQVVSKMRQAATSLGVKIEIQNVKKTDPRLIDFRVLKDGEEPKARGGRKPRK